MRTDLDNAADLICRDVQIEPEVVERAWREGRGRGEAIAAERQDLSCPEVRQAFVDVFSEAFVEAFLASYREGALLERARIAGIVTSSEAAGRPEEALRLALETRLVPSEASFILAAGTLSLVRDARGTRDDAVSRLALSAGLTGRA